MLVFDIYGKRVENKLVFEMPYHRFDWKDEVAVQALIIEWGSTKGNACAVIESDLVDMNSQNKKQQLFGFVKSSRSAITNIMIENPVFYSVQNHDLSSVTMNVKSMFG